MNQGDRYDSNRSQSHESNRQGYSTQVPTQHLDYDSRRDYGNSDLDQRRYQGLSASGVAGYEALHVGGDASEPASPILGDSYEPSTASGSSGTKHEQHSGRTENSRDTISSDGSFERNATEIVSFKIGF